MNGAKASSEAQAFSPLSFGATIITGPYADHAAVVHALIVHALLSGSKNLPIPVPKGLEVYDMRTGSPRQLENQKIKLESVGISSKLNKRLNVKSIEASTYVDWSHPCSVANVSTMMSPRSGCAIVLQQQANSRLAEHGFWKLDAEAKRLEHRVIFLAPYSKENTAFSHPITDEVFHIIPCETDPGYEHGFVVACPELFSGWGADTGKFMCCVSTEPGVLEATYSAYVSDSLKVRLMSALRSRDWTMAEIGQAMEQNKSTVSRALKGVPKFDASEWDYSDLYKWFEACDLDPDLIETVEEFEADQEVEADIGPYELNEGVGEEQVVAEKDRNTRNTCNTPKKRR